LLENTIENPLVSVVCLCYNNGDRLLATLDSIRNQTYKSWELFIVDDASGDNSVELIKKWIDNNTITARVIQNNKNLGIGASLNNSLKYCSGVFFTLIGDDEWDKNFLKNLVTIFSKLPSKVAMVYSKANIFDKIKNSFIKPGLEPLEVIAEVNYPRMNELLSPLKDNPDCYVLKKELLFDVLFWINPIISFCVMIRLDSLKGINGFDENYIMEDYPTWFKISLHSDVVFADKFLGVYNKYRTNTSDNIALINSQVHQIRSNYLKKVTFTDTRKHFLKEELKSILRKRGKKNKFLFVLANPSLIKLKILDFLANS
jgi:glycosyltransferase involved in cell wall biosynthesis